MLNEQQLGMSGMVDPETAAQAGKIIGLKYVLMSAWSEWDADQIRPTIDSIEAYEAYVESIPETAPGQMRSITRFKKVKYARHYQMNRVYARVFYQLVSTQTSQIVSSEVIAVEKKDEYEKFVYKGNVNQLYPELPRGNNLPSAPREWREKFGKISGSIISQEELANQLSQQIALKMSDEVRLYVER
jgi:hypothetical protein